MKYLKLTELFKGTADVITDAIVDYLTSKAPVVLDIQKMAGGACDGASVMLGVHNGVVSRLKAKVPHFIHTHCAAHRLSLAASHASSASKWVQRFEIMLNQIYAFFSQSSTRTAELLEVQKVLKEPQLKLQRATETRWLSHQSAVDALRRSYQAVKTALEQEAIEGDATAISLSLELSKPTFVAALLLLSDVLAILGNLSRTFQIEGLNLISVEQLITSFLTSLSDLKANPFKGGYLSTLPEMLSTQGISAPLDQESFKAQAQSYIARVIENIKTRFPQVTCLGYFDPRNVEKATPTVMLEVGEMLPLMGTSYGRNSLDTNL